MKSVTRIAVFREEFAKLGYSFEDLNIGGHEYTKFISPRGVRWLYKNSNGWLPMPYVSGSMVQVNKALSAEYASGKGIRVPRVVRADSSIQSAEEYRRLLGLKPGDSLVVKPADGTLSRGVSTDVKTDDQLARALNDARKISSNVIVQERVEGDEYRFVYVGRRLSAVIVKQKARVVGDGHSTVRSLVIDENHNRLMLSGLQVAYPQLSLERIKQDGVDLDYVPEEGRVVKLNDSTMLEDGASFYEVSEEIDSSYADIANKLAEDFGGGYLAVDIVIKNAHERATDDNYAFLEFNNIPASLFYYVCRNNPEVPVMRELVSYIDKILHLDQ